MCGDGGAEDAARAARERDEARRAQINLGTDRINSEFSQFDDGFFDGRSQSYLDFAMPQVDQQSQKARDALIFSLSRGGGLSSSAGAKNLNDFEAQVEAQKQSIQSRATDIANQARSQVEDARGQLLTQLNASGNASSTAQQAVARAATLTRPTSFEPLANLFQNVTAAAANSKLASDASGVGGVQLFSNASGGGASRIVT